MKLKPSHDIYMVAFILLIFVGFITAWRQPLGSEDSYHLGDKVSHNEKHWVSDVDANVWAHGVCGWSEV